MMTVIQIGLHTHHIGWMAMEFLTQDGLDAGQVPQSTFLVRYFDEDWGWRQTRITAASEEELRANFDGQISGVVQIQ